MVQLFTLTFIVKYNQVWLDVIVDQLAHAWNSNNVVGLVNHEDILIKVLAEAEQDHAVNIVGGMSIQSRFEYDIQTEFIHEICRYDQLKLFQLLYIVMFQGIVNVVHEVIVHVTVVFHVVLKIHVQLWFVHQFRHIVQLYSDVMVQVWMQVNAQEYIFTQVNEYINIPVEEYIFVNGKLNVQVLDHTPKFSV